MPCPPPTAKAKTPIGRLALPGKRLVGFGGAVGIGGGWGGWLRRSRRRVGPRTSGWGRRSERIIGEASRPSWNRRVRIQRKRIDPGLATAAGKDRNVLLSIQRIGDGV